MTHSGYTVKYTAKKMREKGVCWKCGKRDERTEEGRWMCADCARKYNEYMRERRKGTAGVRERELAKKRYHSRMSAGKCAKCGKPLANIKFKWCQECLDRSKILCKRWYQKKKGENNGNS